LPLLPPASSFSTEILEKVRAEEGEICELTLHVGLGTFSRFTAKRSKARDALRELRIPKETAGRIQAARDAGRPILAIGTTVVPRALKMPGCDRDIRFIEFVLAGKADAQLLLFPDSIASSKVC